MEQLDTFQQLLAGLQAQLVVLPDKSEENPDNTLRALWLAASGAHFSPIAAQSQPLPKLDAAQLRVLDELIGKRISGVPLAHLTQRQNFLGLEYIVSPGLYIPRKETELLARAAIGTWAEHFSTQTTATAIDICAGIGTVALAIACHCANTRVFGTDIYVPAIAAAKVNVEHFGLQSRAEFYVGDLFKPLEPAALAGSVDIVVSAPPYISSAKVKNLNVEIAAHEQTEAFDAGPFGLSVFNKLIANSPQYLKTAGYLLVECGLGQGDFLANRLRQSKYFDAVDELRDENGDVRVLKARRNAQPVA